MSSTDPDLFDKNKNPTLTSLELWAASKILARECATESKEFVICKKEKGLNPSDCLDNGQKVMKCSYRVVDEIKGKFNKEYVAFQKCLDKNDYRFDDCRKEEKAFLDCWNEKR